MGTLKGHYNSIKTLGDLSRSLASDPLKDAKTIAANALKNLATSEDCPLTKELIKSYKNELYEAAARTIPQEEGKRFSCLMECFLYTCNAVSETLQDSP